MFTLGFTSRWDTMIYATPEFDSCLIGVNYELLVITHVYLRHPISYGCYPCIVDRYCRSLWDYSGAGKSPQIRYCSLTLGKGLQADQIPQNLLVGDGFAFFAISRCRYDGINLNPVIRHEALALHVLKRFQSIVAIRRVRGVVGIRPLRARRAAGKRHDK